MPDSLLAKVIRHSYMFGLFKSILFLVKEICQHWLSIYYVIINEICANKPRRLKRSEAIGGRVDKQMFEYLITLLHLLFSLSLIQFYLYGIYFVCAEEWWIVKSLRLNLYRFVVVVKQMNLSIYWILLIGYIIQWSIQVIFFFNRNFIDQENCYSDNR